MTSSSVECMSLCISKGRTRLSESTTSFVYMNVKRSTPSVENIGIFSDLNVAQLSHGNRLCSKAALLTKDTLQTVDV